jgi:type I restriction enzyme M protein
MSSQASSAGRDEATVRQKLVETGAVDVMVDIRGNFFYTRTVPCQLWFFDRSKERDEARRDKVLMLDARSVYRKVSRAICDFSPEQQRNIAAIVWLYRGQSDKFLMLVDSYLDRALAEGKASGLILDAFTAALDKLKALAQVFATLAREPDPLADTWKELVVLRDTVVRDFHDFEKEIANQAKAWSRAASDNAGLHASRKALHPTAESCRDLTKQIDLAAKLAGRLIDIAFKDLAARDSELWPSAELGRARKALEAARAEAVAALHEVRYFVKQSDWLQERFPEAALRDVAGLVRVVDRATIATHDWSLTPGRYVGVAPEEVDEEFDFEEALRSIRIDLTGLNEEAVALAARIDRNFEELGA